MRVAPLAALLIALADCAHASPKTQPHTEAQKQGATSTDLSVAPPPPAQPPNPRGPRKRPSADDTQRRECPPDPPAPEQRAQVCGDGIAEDVYQRICASCVPGGCCPCGWVPGAGSEECDGADLRGKSCQSLGFAGGTLRCAASCAMDTSGCSRSTSGASGQVNALPDLNTAAFRQGPGMGANGGKVIIGGAVGLYFDDYVVDGATGKLLGHGRLIVGGDYEQNGLQEFYSPHGPQTTGGRAVFAPLGDGFLTAIQRFGKNGTTVLARVHANGEVDPFVATTLGPPLFLVSGAGGFLLGTGGAKLTLSKLDANGALQKSIEVSYAKAPDIYDALSAAAVATPSGFLVATSGREGYVGVDVVTVDSELQHLTQAHVANSGRSVAVASGDHPYVVWGTEDGVYGVDPALGKPVKLADGRPVQVLAATVRGGKFKAWIDMPTGELNLIHGSWPEPLTMAKEASVPQTRGLCGTVSNDAVYAFFADESARAAPALYRALR